ncbi:hypothetical protein [Tuberibacillus calidus]|uniref:hypothetical protein n=1 Tax=Tuberibacillus calidus TaxID=340097 RepID=UPI000688BA04|nr:hypothetical protein [Tuberibacillus calidus]
MKTIFAIFTIMFLAITPTKAFAFNPAFDIIEFRHYPSLSELKDTSDLIGLGEIKGVTNQYVTARRIAQGRLVNYIQRFDMRQAFKGRPQKVLLLNTGVSPLPPPRDPINARYPGPLANGQYIIFLKKIPGTPYYQLNGGWQGLYPVIQGKTVSLYHEGFPELHQLTPDQFMEKLRRE